MSSTKDDLSALRETRFEDALTKLEDLLTQGRRAFLIGAGCSKCAGLPLIVELTQKTLNSESLEATAKAILQGIRDGLGESATIEDYLSELVDLLAIAERRSAKKAPQTSVNVGGAKYDVDQLRAAVESIKRALAEVIDQPASVGHHRDFVKAVHRPLRPGKAAPSAVDYLVLNYDTLLETALALERIPYADGMEGGGTGWWSPSTLERSDIQARVLKLHGSIDWRELPSDPMPRRINSTTVAENDGRIVIWPASTKYRETQRDPYAQLSDLGRRVLNPQKGQYQVLVICGYSFGDSHINIELERGLRESDGRLTMVVLTYDEAPANDLRSWTDDLAISSQILVFGRRGFFHGITRESTDVDLPWWKFENFVRLLGGER
ncbi:SIR2 family protein [Burkholderia thailandensis]|uniref:SIR2 family protein n=1 Tax=Burkholderia thailandensis TaxID=57975 RepID=UPI00217F1236|nr:SIR2 family protein [Burkholderia thailandensis]MCS6479756.1 SIR2 family protein [Burkholderia thailandensis]